MIRIAIVGALPPPIGGVTVFLRRLVDTTRGEFDLELLDLRSDFEKPLYFDGHRVSPFRNRYLGLLWLQYQLLRNAPEVVHFNFSDFKGLLFAAVLLRRKAKVMITLHHGKQKLSPTIKKIISALGPLIAQRFDLFHALNDEQAEFYKVVFKITDENIFLCPSLITPQVISQKISESVQALVDDMQPYILTSGVGEWSNRFDLVLEYWANRPKDGTKLLLCIYGDSVPEYFGKLKKEAKGLENFFLVGSMQEHDFNYVLHNATLYLRPAEVDSFGIAVADAVSLGVPVLASDACKRLPQVNTYPNFDYVEMFSRMETLLTSEPQICEKQKVLSLHQEYHRQYRALANGTYSKQ